MIRQFGQSFLGFSVGLAMLGGLSSLVSAQPMPSQELVRAIRDSFGSESSYSQSTYMFGEFDLDGDGIKEVIAYMEGPSCGWHNCTWSIFQKNRNGTYQSLNVKLLNNYSLIKRYRPQIAILKSKTGGWYDIAIPLWKDFPLDWKGWHMVSLGANADRRNGKEIFKDIQALTIFDFKKMRKFNLGDDGVSNTEKSDIQSVTKRIQDLPDGNYFYGQDPSPDRGGRMYASFNKKGTDIIGSKYYSQSERSGCFTGEARQNDIISKTIATSPPLGTNQGQAWTFQTVPVDAHQPFLSIFPYSIDFEKSPDFAKRSIEHCRSIFADRVAIVERPQPKLSSSPALPTPVQFPTQAEFDRIARVIPEKILSNSDRNARQGLKSVWRRNNSPIASFLGGWQSQDGNQIYVYPSNQQRRVCVVTQSNSETELSLGTVTGSELRYKGDKGLFLIRADGDDVVAARASKSSSLTPAFAIPGSATDLSDDSLESMKQAKCITQLPGGPVAQKPATKNPDTATSNLAPIEISNLGCTEKLAIPYCRSFAADSGILFETFNTKKNSNGSIDITFIAFNRGSADALIEIYDAQDKLKDIQIIDGNKPPTGLVKGFGDMYGRYPLSFFSRYPIGDMRRGLEKANVIDRVNGKEPNEIEMTLPPGGSIKITKSSSYAQLYNAVMLSLDTAKLSGKSDFKSLKSYRQMAIRFVKESGKNTKINIFKSAPSAQSILSLDFIDPRKMAEILQKFFAYSFTAEGKPLGEDPLKNPIVSGIADVVVDDVDEGIEVALTKYIMPGLGRIAEVARTVEDAFNIITKSVDLSNAITNGENGTITVRHRDNKLSR